MNIFNSAAKLILTALLAISAMPAAAVTEVTGTTPGGAAYRIAVPDDWVAGGPLVLVQHVYNQDVDTAPDLGPLRDVQLASGYAVAASGYRQGGWALFTAVEDNAELVDAFTAQFGAPGSLVTSGDAMGGLVAVKFAEDDRFRDRTQGVLAMCPMLAGPEFWDDLFDLKMIYDAVCGDVPGGSFPEGDAPYPWALNLEDIPAGLGRFEDMGFGNRLGLGPVTTCTGLGFGDVSPSPEQRARSRILEQAAFPPNGPVDDNFRPPLQLRLAYAIYGLSDLVRAPDKLNGGNAFFNRVVAPNGFVDLDYGADAPANLRRVVQDDYLPRLDFDRVSAPDSSATARIVTMASSRDIVALPAHARIFVNGPGNTEGNRIALEVKEPLFSSHCEFSAAERAAAWDTLLAASPASSAGDTCAARQAAGLAGPCRFGTGVPAPEFRSRWDELTPGAETATKVPTSGLWFDPERNGEGILVEELNGALGVGPRYFKQRRNTVNWYTYAPPGDPDPGPRWLTGVGFQTSQGMYIPHMTLTRGARFGADFDPADVERIDWGSVSVTMDARYRMQLRYDGPPGWGSGVRNLIPLALADHVPARDADQMEPPDPALFDVKTASGTYFNTGKNGEGLQLTILPREGGGKRANLVYYTYDNSGRQLWLIGSRDDVEDGAGEIIFPVIATTGTVFGDDFNGDDVERIPWGTVTLSIEDRRIDPALEPSELQAVSMRWNAIDPEFGEGGYPLIRLTRVRP